MSTPDWNSIDRHDMLLLASRGRHYICRVLRREDITNTSGPRYIVAVTNVPNPGIYAVTPEDEELLAHWPGFFAGDPLPERVS